MDYLNNMINFNSDRKGYWQPDNTSVKCSSENCNIEFGFLERKHHCRYCGKIFCNKCSNYRIYLPKYNKETRVCEKCNIEIKKQQNIEEKK